MSNHPFDLVRDVLDHAVIDSRALPCGMVDDVELDCEPGRPLLVAALLVGPGSWQRRLPRWAAVIARRIFGANTVKIPWARVEKIGERIQLDATAEELGLGNADRLFGKWIARLPLS
jgi:sporulation protein YlmC with PRC-barrel domain